MKAWVDMSARERGEAAHHQVRRLGLSYTEAAALLGTSKNSISGALGRFEGRTPKNPPRERRPIEAREREAPDHVHAVAKAQVSEFTRMWTEGATLKFIAWKLGCSSTTVRDTAARLGLPPRANLARHASDVLTVRVEQRTADKVRELAARRGVHLSALLRELIDKALAESGQTE